MAQNEVTEAYLESLLQRAPMRERLRKRWNDERYGIPVSKKIDEIADLRVILLANLKQRLNAAPSSADIVNLIDI